MATTSILSATTGMHCNFQSPRTNQYQSGLHPKKRYYTSCKATAGRVERRDILIGLGGAAAGLSASHGALAAPVQAPEFSKCHRPKDNVPDGLKCCPPYDNTVAIADFRPPPPESPMRVRPAAHQVDGRYLAKYEKAYELMKKLPATDPRSFEQQWKVHCAYCEGSFDQVGFPNLQLQVHRCWLFFPWHRIYLYFHERILGKLIGDDTFALPFWNWDAPAGMTLPTIYTSNKKSTLYNENRNPAHLPPVVTNLNYAKQEPSNTTEQLIKCNLTTMYRQMVSGAKKTNLFIGEPYRAGDQVNTGGAGTIENVPHDTLHGWTGDPHRNGGEDMGKFYSAGRDPVFYAHHANVDRLWYVWLCLRPGNKNFTDPDWLNANFLFYDEEACLVRVKVRDCLDTLAMRYRYQDVPLPWVNSKPTPTAVPRAKKGVAPSPPATTTLPAKLDEAVRVTVKRPRVSRSLKEKEEEEEVLVLEGIKLADHDSYLKFDVFVNEPGVGGELDTTVTECAGSFVHIPHRHDKKITSNESAARFGISELLDEIGADGDESIVVTLVPRCNGQKVTVGGVRIEFCK